MLRTPSQWEDADPTIFAPNGIYWVRNETEEVALVYWDAAEMTMIGLLGERDLSGWTLTAYAEAVIEPPPPYHGLTNEQREAVIELLGRWHEGTL